MGSYVKIPWNNWRSNASLISIPSSSLPSLLSNIFGPKGSLSVTNLFLWCLKSQYRCLPISASIKNLRSSWQSIKFLTSSPTSTLSKDLVERSMSLLVRADLHTLGNKVCSIRNHTDTLRWQYVFTCLMMSITCSCDNTYNFASLTFFRLLLGNWTGPICWSRADCMAVGAYSVLSKREQSMVSMSPNPLTSAIQSMML